MNADVLAHSWGVFFMFSSVRQKVCFLEHLECEVEDNYHLGKLERTLAKANLLILDELSYLGVA